eukprot:5582307-Pleurochrysis_carterae.AAC.2
MLQKLHSSSTEADAIFKRQTWVMHARAYKALLVKARTVDGIPTKLHAGCPDSVEGGMGSTDR